MYLYPSYGLDRVPLPETIKLAWHGVTIDVANQTPPKLGMYHSFDSVARPLTKRRNPKITQCFSINGTTSEAFPVFSGLSQGSILDPCKSIGEEVGTVC